MELVSEVEQYLASASVEEVEALYNQQKPSDLAEPTNDIVEPDGSELIELEVSAADQEHLQDTGEITIDRLEDIVADDDMVRASVTSYEDISEDEPI
jgi:hypothetical protein